MIRQQKGNEVFLSVYKKNTANFLRSHEIIL
jgi:hypothetical protein